MLPEDFKKMAIEEGLSEEDANLLAQCKPVSMAWEDVSEELARANIKMALRVREGETNGDNISNSSDDIKSLLDKITGNGMKSKIIPLKLDKAGLEKFKSFMKEMGVEGIDLDLDKMKAESEHEKHDCEHCPVSEECDDVNNKKTKENISRMKYIGRVDITHFGGN